jgi:translation initiation factor 3 subunit E
MASTPPSSTAKYDLTSTLSKFLDLHLMFPLLEFVDGNEILGYNPADIQKARLALVKPTNMVEYAIEIYQELNGGPEVPVPPEMEAQKNAVYQQIEAYDKKDPTLANFFSELVRDR